MSRFLWWCSFRCFRLLLFAGVLLLSSCNGGVAPLEQESESFHFEFPVPVHGGDPTGVWVPIPRNALEFRLADPEQIAGMVDTLILRTWLLCQITINPDSTFGFQALLRVKPVPIISGIALNIAEISDTVLAHGHYRRPAPYVLIFPLETETFPLDTLGFSAGDDTLTLVTQVATFPYPGFDSVEYYMILRLRRARNGRIAAVRTEQTLALPGRKHHEQVQKAK
jgi:hypothetical protein